MRFGTVSKIGAAAAMAVAISLMPGYLSHAAENVFLRTLRTGMSGPDVLRLQQILNEDAQTVVAWDGPGSKGQETAYFGRLTELAVIRFQEKNRAEILIPNDLAAGTGIVGPSTRAVISRLISSSGGTAVAVAPSGQTAPAQTPPQTIPPSAGANPNLKNLDVFLAAIDSVGAKQGRTKEDLSLVKDQVRKDIATTTDLMKTFTSIVESGSSKLIQGDDEPDGPLASVMSRISRFMAKALAPQEAIAQGSSPFGGALYYSYYCTCSFNWLITLQPLPPTYVVLLSYTPFSQAYLTYNIPYTNWLLGKYSSSGECAVYAGYSCYTIPSEGMITPQVGSSAF